MIARHWTGIVALNFQAIRYEVFATLSKTKNDMSETKGMMQKKKLSCSKLPVTTIQNQELSILSQKL